MVRFLRQHRERLRTSDGQRYRVRAYAERRRDRRWEAWLEFVDQHGFVILTDRETTQRTLADARYWAAGLGPAYIEGAFGRAVRRFGRPVFAAEDQPH